MNLGCKRRKGKGRHEINKMIIYANFMINYVNNIEIFFIFIFCSFMKISKKKISIRIKENFSEKKFLQLKVNLLEPVQGKKKSSIWELFAKYSDWRKI